MPVNPWMLAFLLAGAVIKAVIENLLIRPLEGLLNWPLRKTRIE